MTDQSPFSVGEPEWERGLWWMVIASGALHLLAIAALILIPHSFLHRPPPLVSYTVDLIAPDKLGGTNVVPGGKGQTNAPPIAVAKVEPPKPPPPKPEPPKPQEVKPPEPPKPPEAAKPEPPKAEPPKVEAPPKPNEVALAEKPKTIMPPTAAKPPPSPQVKAPPSPPPKVVAKPEPAKPAPPPKANAKAEQAAKAEKTKAEKEAAAAQARDQQIAAAIRKVEQQVGAHGGGTGKETMAKAGGPISVGPGEGAGGAVRGVEYLLYYNQMISRIKQTWAWAGSNRSLEAAVHFSITETGDIVNVRIARPSGDASYDASVERAIKAATPLPPPPAAYSKEFSEVELTFRPEDLKM